MQAKLLHISPKAQVAIVYRPNTPKALKVALELVAWLKKNDFVAWTAPEQKNIKGAKLMSRKSQFDKVELVIALGGDGTYLRAIRLIEGRPIPILGINMGSLGFLTVVRQEELYAYLDDLLKGSLELRPRTMMSIKHKRKGKILSESIALNDVVIERGPYSQLIDISVFCDKFLVSDIKADGLIISSPTGSTAYNLAAGGPIMHPELHAFVATPVAPHSLTSRPFLFPDERSLSLKLKGQCEKANVIVDGIKVADIKLGDELLIQKSKKDHFVVRTPDHNYFDVLREKLKFGDRA